MSKSKIEPICYNFCPKPGDCLVLKYNFENWTREDITEIYEGMVDKFPQLIVIALPDDIVLAQCDPQTVLEELDRIKEYVEERMK